MWYVAGTKKSPNGTLYLNCNVKPGASKQREGIASVGDDAVEICVAAQAREGEANKAVIKVLSEVNFFFHSYHYFYTSVHRFMPAFLAGLLHPVRLARMNMLTGVRFSTFPSRTCRSPKVSSPATRQ